MKKLIGIVALLLSSMTLVAATGADEGNLEWTLEAGVLQVSGTRAMPDFEEGETPWYPDRNVIREVIVGEGTTTIGKYAFSGLPYLQTVQLPTTLTAIYVYAFAYTALQNITLPATLVALEPTAFAGCKKLQEINIGTNPYYATEEGVLFNKLEKQLLVYPVNRTGTAYEVPAFVTKLADGAFRDASLRTLSLPDELEVIGKSAFAGCQALESLRIPAAVTSLGSSFVEGCTSLKEITLEHTTPPDITSQFMGFDLAGCKLIVPEGTREAYRVAPIWKNSGKIIEAGEPDVTLDCTAAGLGVNNALNLQATLLTEGVAADGEWVVKWASSDEAIARVDQNGKITGVKEGTATITVSLEGYEYAVAKCVVTITFIHITDIVLNETEYELPVGGRFRLTATGYPGNASDKEFIFTSGNPTVATVDRLGWVRAVGAGLAVIHVTTANSSEAATCYVTVNDDGTTTNNVVIKENLPVVRTEPSAALLFLPAETQVRIYGLSGHVVYARRLGPGEHRIRLRKGAYILTAGGTPFKLMIRQ